MSGYVYNSSIKFIIAVSSLAEQFLVKFIIIKGVSKQFPTRMTCNKSSFRNRLKCEDIDAKLTISEGD